ncbi:co-chaperone GroES [Candidatus Vidania fulgoroideae]|uniref:Co-chaperone GroES n=1 Tax=Candidatus Vidania fulgoroideorum TaxID=881286 RepID=A0AAX3N8W7_9PROT|nr:co-chaperone GroES [Candidatus Vidania fulgoroideae]WDR79487.1 co-chaperone GroES [Candidatus Vidania fulgoroideae]
MKIKALNNWIILLKKKENKKSKIIVKNHIQNQQGVVLSFGKKVKGIKKNDCVVYKKYSENKIKIESKKYVFIKKKDIFAKIK